MVTTTLGVRTATAVVFATVLLTGCSNSSSDAGEQDAGSGSDSKASGSAPECVGDGKGEIAVGADTSKLPGGSTVAFGESDLEAEKPTVTFDLGKSSKVERKHASDLSVGDKFGVQRGFYVVVSICSDEATIDEF
ncbi:hypothetical protein [Solicola gregarius]|uniref:Uncharacterized protein n=1 Tax=Solicola gregarius TaxID=2908642 RepID=A0AA46TG46_9ACTN|nr:hypothetical protein [Solicola gregarius]UYM04734.1 hypothetical protein L0C25_19680 [Solicola gregarius]